MLVVPAPIVTHVVSTCTIIGLQLYYICRYTEHLNQVYTRIRCMMALYDLN